MLNAVGAICVTFFYNEEKINILKKVCKEFNNLAHNIDVTIVTIENSENKIFQGWMISSSPSASPFEHPIYDIWLKDCNIDSTGCCSIFFIIILSFH